MADIIHKIKNCWHRIKLPNVYSNKLKNIIAEYNKTASEKISAEDYISNIVIKHIDSINLSNGN